MSNLLCESKVIIVTGGGGGIGAATCLRLGEEGASVVVADINETAANEMADRIVGQGGRAVGVQADVTSLEDNVKLADAAVEHFGAIHGIHLNAGIVIPSPVRNGDVDSWHKIINCNLTGPYYGMRSVLKHMGRIGRINALFTQVQQLWTAVDSFDTPAMQPNPADGEPATLKIYPPLSH